MDTIKILAEYEPTDPRLFSAGAEELAMQLSQDNRDQPKNPNKRTQIRKFYDEVVRLSDLANQGNRQWIFIETQLHLLIAKAAYAEGRQLVSPRFKDFIKNGINQIYKPSHLIFYSTFFEAFMGFYRLHGPKS